MALEISDPATETSIRELAAATGETLTEAVRHAIEERLERLRRRQNHGLAGEILEIGARCAALPDRDRRTPNEILGYDDAGLPS